MMIKLISFASFLVTAIAHLAMFACSISAIGLFFHGLYTLFFSNIYQGLTTLGLGIVIGLCAKLVAVIGGIISGILITLTERLIEQKQNVDQENMHTNDYKEESYTSNMDDNDQLKAVAKSLGQNQLKLGQEIADDCFVNGLSTGEFVSLNDISDMIHSKFDYMPHAVESGFLRRMNEYIDSGSVVNLSVENVGIVFIHKDYFDEYIKNQ
ncbi:hypothetical protein L1D56_20375 [Vibrio diabolicus]|uniref:hypothetical protein n=1 Tax=Vibrio diabolicus TaxID=50719 RepID=UPI00211B4F3F|nr:hypothetical protein [Vibrio diabolicus]MCG9622297.1 hypothetical protein [Vibrio diabolicus]